MRTGNLLFYMQRYTIRLKVTLQPNGSIKMEPHHCTAENLRLWQGIARTQTVLAQGLLDNSKNEKPEACLRTLFQEKGWTVEAGPAQSIADP